MTLLTCDGGLLLQGSVQVTAINSDGQNYLGTAVGVYPQALGYFEDHISRGPCCF